MRRGWAGNMSLIIRMTPHFPTLYCLLFASFNVVLWLVHRDRDIPMQCQCFTPCSKQIKTGGSFWKPGNHYIGLKSQPFMAIGIYPTLDIITDHLCCSLCKFFSLYSCVLHSVRCDPIRAGAGALCWDVTEADNQRLLHNIATSHSHNLILWHTPNI